MLLYFRVFLLGSQEVGASRLDILQTMSTFSISDELHTPGYLLQQASFAFKAALKRAFADAGLDTTPEEFLLLSRIPPEGEIQKVLTQHSLKDKTTITRLLDRLVDKGWVTRALDPKNRRQQMITLSAEGSFQRQQMMVVFAQVQTQALKHLSQEDLKRATQVLRQMMSNLELE